MTKYLETKKSSIEEAISSVVKGEGFASDAQRRAAFAQGYKAKGKKDKNEELDETVLDTVLSISKGGSRYKDQEKDKDGKFIVKDRLGKVITSLSPSGAKKFLDSLKDPISGKGSVDALKKDRERRASRDSGGMGVRTRGAPEKNIVNLLRKFKEEVELDEGYESEVLKVLRDADIDGYFKNNKLYVSRRDARDAKKALEDSDEITKLPKMVMEDERMKKLTKRQRQALARVQAKPKSQVSLPKMPDFMKLKKEENEMDIVDTIRNVVEKKLDPVNKDAVKKKFDDRKDKDIDNDGDVDSTDKYLHKRRKAISKAIAKDNNEAYDIGKDYAQHTLEVTPGQDKKDVDKMLNVAYTKNQSMRETLAKVWGLDEGKSPFQKEEEKPLTKTMTGQKPTTVKVNPKIEEK